VLRCLREACDRTGALLIFDEIFTGFGRTGAMFAAEAACVVPDIMCVGKALTGGTTPLSAAIAREHVFEAFLSDDPQAALMHGPTFMANPLACAAANAALDLFEQEPWQENVTRIETQMRRELEPCRSLPGVVDVRVMGAIAAIQLADLGDKEALKARFLEEGVWLRPFGDIVYLTPPFIIAEEDLRRLTGAIVGVLSARGC
jgi:adenosylmethionine-8-amino-7-oxononanoate aminotransferase